MTEMYAPAPAVNVNREALEMAAFEKGRIAGEQEATRRMEAEAHLQHKQMIPAGPTQAELELINLQRPDVVEINRLTPLQRATWALGTLTGLAMIGLTVWWIEDFRAGLSFESDRATNPGGITSMFNTFLLVSVLGLFMTAAAITHYRVFPLRTPPLLNRAWYVMLQAGAVTLYTLGIVALHRSPADSSYWSAADWCFALGYAITVSHALYSMAHAIFDQCRHRGHKGAQSFADSTNGARILESPEQARDHSAYNQYGRSVYTPAPVGVHTNANTHAPAAPANAPRWAENPATHSEDYWLMARAKWAVVGFWAMGVAILMQFAALQHITAAGRDTFAQGQPGDAAWDESGRERTASGVASLMILMTLAFISYTAMPPRTTFVKNGILRDQTRRTSISHNAETQLGHQQIV